METSHRKEPTTSHSTLPNRKSPVSSPRHDLNGHGWLAQLTLAVIIASSLVTIVAVLLGTRYYLNLKKLEPLAGMVMSLRVVSTYSATVVLAVVLETVLLYVHMRTTKKLETSVFIDPVTGGNTKTHFEIIATDMLRRTGAEYSFVHMNIRNFKACISRFGQKHTDLMLKNIHDEIFSTLGDDETMGRSDDEGFIILLRSQDMPELQRKLSVWTEAVRKFGTHSQIPQRIDLEYGIHIVSNTEKPVRSMIEMAAQARDGGKPRDKKKGNLSIYDEFIGGGPMYRKEVTDRMQRAIANQEFIIYMQPKYELTTRTIAGAEALVRWRHPSHGLLSPGLFIPILEDSGQIRDLDLYVFRKVCEWLQSFVDTDFPPPPVSVNISRYHFIKHGFIQDFIDIWKEFTIPAQSLELEFTETMLADNMEEFQEVVDHMHTIGFRCSMDDFGTGFSSLNMLCRLSVDTVKLDRQFFHNDFEIPSKESITISHVIDLIKALNMTVVAEGVEHEAQVEFLRSQGCDLVQGFFFSKPVPAEHLKAMLMEQSLSSKRNTSNHVSGT